MPARFVSVLALAATTAIGVCAESDDPPGRAAVGERAITGDILVQRQYLDNHGVELSGQGYGCVVVTPRQSPRHHPRLVLYVTDDEARSRAESLRSRLTGTPVSVRLTSQRFALGEMQTIQKAVTEALPDDARSLSVGRLGFVEVRRSDCPPLQIVITRSTETPSVRRWADDAV
jgi:hypothetical protein